MNTNPKAKRILCYGDSNTWGAVPFGGRFSVNERWTGLLQGVLGYDYEVIEEGLGARTTNIDDRDKSWRNGFRYLRPCLETHYPIDACILWLGTNDLKKYFERNAKDIAEALRSLIKVIKDVAGADTKILVVSSPKVLQKSKTGESQFESGYEKSLELGDEINKMTREESVYFVDLQKEGIEPDKEEGLHLSQGGHKKTAEVFAKEIKKIFNL